MFKEIKKTFQWGKHTVTMSTGKIARQADSAVFITIDGTSVLCAVTVKKAEQNNSFFPLTINYVEKTYAAGKIPGGFFRREGRPTEKETLTSRLIDRPLRSIFADGYKQEVQVVAQVISLNPEVASDITAMVGASCAVALAGLPIAAPIAAARVGFCNEEYVLNPSPEELQDSCLDLVVAGSDEGLIMVESEAMELSEIEMKKAIEFGLDEMKVVINAINEMVQEANTQPMEWSPEAVDTDLQNRVKELAEADLVAAYSIADKMQRYEAVKASSNKVAEALCSDSDDEELKSTVKNLFHDLEKTIVRQNVLSGKPRIDGRDTKTVRPIDVELGILERTHGSVLFTRGETQAIVAATLGTERDAQKIDDLDGDRTESFMLHYNFPPYSVGETGFMGSPKRREIGHGRLARRAVQAVIPQDDDFPYTLRVVSEITESNGSSSMATVCGTSLALMEAGVPISAPVAGIAMGLIKEGDQFAVLTDILGDEDHLGDMDFKVAGTEEGITALQMDIKTSGITSEIMEAALNQAKDGRMHILGIMNNAIDKPREEVSEFAPRYTTISIKPDKIRDVIGKGGATIRELTESTNTTIEINDDGLVKIAAINQADADLAVARIEELTAEAEIGRIYNGQVVKIMDFGAIVTFLGGACQGLVHISQISDDHVDNVGDYVAEGDSINVKVIDIDRQGRVRLSMKQAAESESPAADDNADDSAESSTIDKQETHS